MNRIRISGFTGTKGGLSELLKTKYGGEVSKKLAELISQLVGIAGGSQAEYLSSTSSSKLGKSIPLKGDEWGRVKVHID